jgi:hypothetical protein
MKKNCGLAHLGILVAVIIIGVGAIGFFVFSNSFSGNNLQSVVKETLQPSKKVSIPLKILDNKYGFPSGGPTDVDIFDDFGIAWARPHPGPFQWGVMQKSAKSKIDFNITDRFVKGYQEAEFGTLVTLFPFAEWDQKKLANYEKCLVSGEDIFVEPKFRSRGIDYLKEGGMDKKVFGEKDFKDEKFMMGEKAGKIGKEGMQEEPIFLPQSRCNPYDWEEYLDWVKAVVERYDGDGVSDMPGLSIPIKYWEVMNEPDLNAAHLDFYQGTPSDYAELLVRTAKAIHEADPEAKVLIAGAAGGNKNFLDFYRAVFKNKEAQSAFDIGNVHCISNDDFASYNVEPYRKMLAEFGIGIPVWVTEAEALVSMNSDVNASQTYASTQKALELGAEKIFYAHQKFDRGLDKPSLPETNLKLSDYKIQLDGSDPVSVFQVITTL